MVTKCKCYFVETKQFNMANSRYMHKRNPWNKGLRFLAWIECYDRLAELTVRCDTRIGSSHTGYTPGKRG